MPRMLRFSATLLTLNLVAASLAPLAAQGTSPATLVARAVSADAFLAHLQYLSDDLLEGRAPATRGGELAAKYIAAQFRRLGLEPMGDSGSYFHRVPVIALTPDPTLQVTGPNPVTLAYRDDYVLWSMRNEDQVNLSAPFSRRAWTIGAAVANATISASMKTWSG